MKKNRILLLDYFFLVRGVGTANRKADYPENGGCVYFGCIEGNQSTW